jgi:hypothetical protein
MLSRILRGNKFKNIIIHCSWVKYLVTRLLVKINKTENVSEYLVKSMTFLRCLFNFSYFIDTKCVLTITHFCLFTANFYTRYHQTTPLKTSTLHFKISPSMETTRHLSITDWSAMKEFYIRWLINLKILSNKIKFPWKKNAHNITES